MANPQLASTMRHFLAHSSATFLRARVSCVAVSAVFALTCLNAPTAAAGDARSLSNSDLNITSSSRFGLLASNTTSAPTSWQPPEGVLLAQSDGDDAYDPFADYSEFEESMEEEEDINFFRNGRLLTMGFNFGYRGWTGNLQSIYTGSPSFGLFMSYFFDLRFALQFGFMMSDHTLTVIPTTGADPVQGTVNFTDVLFALKYYFNTQNVTRGLADMNPYVIGGFSQLYRTATVSGNDKFSKDSAFAFDIGGGLEIPIMRNKMYYGVQAMYQLVSFADEGRVIDDQNGNPTGVNPAGDSFNVIGVLGVNF